MHNQVAQTACAASMAAAWIDRNKSGEPGVNAIAHQQTGNLTRLAIEARNAFNSLSKNPALTVFGPSQAGKSVLINSVLKAATGGNLSNNWDKHEVNFNDHLNPKGDGSEATGVVTRFSSADVEHPEKFPVVLKVFREVDLVMILANSFFRDFERGQIILETTEDALVKKLKELQSYVDKEARKQWLTSYVPSQSQSDKDTSQDADRSNGEDSAIYKFSDRKDVTIGSGEFNYIHPDDIVELADYIKYASYGEFGGWDELPEFWSLFREMIPFMSYEGRVQAFSILWQNLAIHTDIFKRLSAELLKLKGAPVVYGSLESAVKVTKDEDKSKVERYPDGSIIDVKCISFIFEDKDSWLCKCAVSADGNEEVTISRAVLSALSYEMRFKFDGAGDFAKFDIIDLPGAKERKKFTVKQLDMDRSVYAYEILRRGKVAYLFDLYSRRKEFEQMLFCIGSNTDKHPEDLRSLMDEWVKINAGESPETRKKYDYKPISVIFTMFDIIYKSMKEEIEKGNSPDSSGAESKTIDFVTKMEWFANWDGDAYDRLFMVRNLEFPMEFLYKVPDGTKTETSVKTPEAKADTEKVTETLLQSEKFKKHFRTESMFRQNLEKLVAPNDGASSYVAENVLGHFRDKDDIRQTKYDGVGRLISEPVKVLSGFAAFDGGEALTQARKESLRLAAGLLQCNLIYPCFGLLRQLLDLNSETLSQCYEVACQSGSSAEGFSREVRSAYRENIMELTSGKSTRLANVVDLVTESYVSRYLKNFSENVDSYKESFNFCWNGSEGRFLSSEEFSSELSSLLVNIIKHVGKAFESGKLGIKEYMFKVLKDNENTTGAGRNERVIFVELMGFILSDFNLYAGCNLLPVKAEEDKHNNELNEMKSRTSSEQREHIANFINRQALKGGILGSEEGPENCFYLDSANNVVYSEEHGDNEVFCQKVKRDYTSNLPSLGKETSNYNFRLVSDFVSALSYMICHVNIKADSDYNISYSENALLCKLIKDLEEFTK